MTRACVLLTCWLLWACAPSAGNDPTPTQPQGDFVDLFASNTGAYGLKADGSLVAWGLPFMLGVPGRSGPWKQVSALGFNVCGLRTDGSAACWGSDQEVVNAMVPAEKLRWISTGGSMRGLVCGITEAQGEILCWGDPESALLLGVLPEDMGQNNKRVYISFMEGNVCRLNDAGLANCWSRTADLGTGEVPTNIPFDELFLAAAGLGCGIRSDNHSLECWGLNALSDPQWVPDGPIISIAGSAVAMWGLRPSGELLCWGDTDYCADYTLPDWPYTKLTGWGGSWCGLTRRGQILCNSIHEDDLVGSGPPVE